VSTASTAPPVMTETATAVTVRLCALYPSHRTPVIEQHHIAPKSWFASASPPQPVSTPMIGICGLCHNNTHAALDGIIRGKDVSKIPPRAVDLARQGLRIARDKGLSPRPTL
jgi:hypothetical protein